MQEVVRLLPLYGTPFVYIKVFSLGRSHIILKGLSLERSLYMYMFSGLAVIPHLHRTYNTKCTVVRVYNIIHGAVLY